MDEDVKRRFERIQDKLDATLRELLKEDTSDAQDVPIIVRTQRKADVSALSTYFAEHGSLEHRFRYLPGASGRLERQDVLGLAEQPYVKSLGVRKKTSALSD